MEIQIQNSISHTNVQITCPRLRVQKFNINTAQTRKGTSVLATVLLALAQSLSSKIESPTY